MGYTDPETVHNPASGQVAPASWGDQVNANQQWFADPARVKVYRSSNFTTSTATQTAVLWNAEEWDTDTMHSTVSNTDRLTATTAGRYIVLCQVLFAAGSTATTGRRLQIWKNGTSGVLLASDLIESPSAVAYNRLQAAVEVELAASDYVSAVVYQDSTVNLDVIGAALGTSDRSWMSMRWIGTS